MSLFPTAAVTEVPFGSCSLKLKVNARYLVAADTILHVYKDGTLVAAYAATEIDGPYVTYALDSTVTQVPGGYGYDIKHTLYGNTDIQRGLLVVAPVKTSMDVLYGPCDHT